MTEAYCKPRMETVETLASSFDCKQKAVRAVRYNNDGEYCLTCGSDKTIKLWNPHRSLVLNTYHGHGNEVLDVQSSCDNAHMCSASMDRCVFYWDVATGQTLRRYRGHDMRVNCVAFNEEGSVILSGAIDGKVNVWDVRSKRLEPIQSLDEAKDSLTSVKVTNYEIFTGSMDKHLRRYDIRSGKLTTDFIGSPVISTALTRDGQCILTSSPDDRLRLIDKKSGELLNEYKGHQNDNLNIDCVISSDDKQILSGSRDKHVYVWDLIKATLIGKLKHDAVVDSISYHPTKPELLASCYGKVYLWKARFA